MPPTNKNKWKKNIHSDKRKKSSRPLDFYPCNVEAWNFKCEKYPWISEYLQSYGK